MNHATHNDERPALAASSSGAPLGLRDVTVRFGGITALDSVTLDVGIGEIVGLIGPNGAGKTTLFDVISGTRGANSGEIFFAGQDVTRRSAATRARLGMRRTFQRVQTFGWLTVEDNVLVALEGCDKSAGFAADTIGWPGRRRAERARRALAEETLVRCGLTHVRHELASSLPIGLARMVELARAMVDAPRLLLLDEPASGLDTTEASRLGAILDAMRGGAGCSVVLVEHDAGFVMERCDRVVVLAQGSVLAAGTAAEIQGDARVREAYLGQGT